jgi:hypothetical protein
MNLKTLALAATVALGGFIGAAHAHDLTEMYAMAQPSPQAIANADVPCCSDPNDAPIPDSIMHGVMKGWGETFERNALSHNGGPISFDQLLATTQLDPGVYNFLRDHRAQAHIWAMEGVNKVAHQAAPAPSDTPVDQRRGGEYGFPGIAQGVAPTLQNCDIDGRLKGVEIGTAEFRRAVSTFPHHACLATGPNGTFLVNVHGVQPMH